MATCPDCQASSHQDPIFVVEPVLVAQQVGDFSLAGVGSKFPVRETLRLRHGALLGRPHD